MRAGWPDNRSDSKQIQAEAGGKGEVSFTAPSAPASPTLANATAPGTPEPAPASLAGDSGAGKKSSGWSPAVFYVGAGLTAVLGGITVWSGLDTVNNPGADRVKEECGALMQREDCELYKEGLSKQRRTNVLIGVTAGVGVATVLIGVLATDFRGTKAAPATATKRLRPSLNVAPYASLDGGGLQAVGRF